MFSKYLQVSLPKYILRSTSQIIKIQMKSCLVLKVIPYVKNQTKLTIESTLSRPWST